MAGEFAVHLGHGDVYSVEEARTWLSATGWRFASTRRSPDRRVVIARRV